MNVPALKTPSAMQFMIVGTIATGWLCIIFVFAYDLLHEEKELKAQVFAAMKDISLFAGGALVTFLTNLRSQEYRAPETETVKIVQPPSEPIPVQQTPPES